MSLSALIQKRDSGTMPDTPAGIGPTCPLVLEQETAIRDWLTRIGEDDPAVIREVLTECRRDGKARAYFLDLASP
jgi:hypothetical protein